MSDLQELLAIKYLGSLNTIYCVYVEDEDCDNDDVCRKIIAEYYARSRIDAIIKSGASIDNLTLTLEDVEKYLDEFQQTDDCANPIIFKSFSRYFRMQYC